VTLLAFAAERRAVAPLLLSAVQQSTDISCPPGTQQWSVAGEWERQTDRQTDEQCTTT